MDKNKILGAIWGLSLPTAKTGGISPPNPFFVENNASGRTIGGRGFTNRVQLQNAVVDALNAGKLTILDDLGNPNEVGLLQPSNQ